MTFDPEGIDPEAGADVHAARNKDAHGERVECANLCGYEGPLEFLGDPGGQGPTCPSPADEGDAGRLATGEVRALEGELDPERRRALALRLIRALTPSDRELLAGELAPEDVLRIVRHTRGLSWSDLVGAHHRGCERASEHACGAGPIHGSGAQRESRLVRHSITSVDAEDRCDGGDIYDYCECASCGATLAYDLAYPP